eukprot:9682025-Heterocapsa_arctica.AAC.1
MARGLPDGPVPPKTPLLFLFFFYYYYYYHHHYHYHCYHHQGRRDAGVAGRRDPRGARLERVRPT